MNFTKTIYNRETLLGMLDIAIKGMIENDLCRLCSLYPDKSKRVCNNEDICESYLFDGLLRELRRQK